MAAWTLYNKFFNGIFVKDQPLFLLAVFMALAGIQFAVMGLLAKVIVRTYHSANRKPPYTVAETAPTGTGAYVRATSPTLVTPTLGAALATSINGNVFTTGTYTLTGGAGKTLTFSNSLTLAGTDGTTMTNLVKP